jgi:hypothetical protein
MTVAFTMTERVAQLHQDNAPVHSVALVQAFWRGAKIASPRSVSRVTAQIWLPANAGFPKAKIAFARKEICGYLMLFISTPRGTPGYCGTPVGNHWSTAV